MSAFKPNATIIRGLQTSEPIELTDYSLVTSHDNFVILRDQTLGHQELWAHNQDFAGYCIRINNKNYEFVSRNE